MKSKDYAYEVHNLSKKKKTLHSHRSDCYKIITLCGKRENMRFAYGKNIYIYKKLKRIEMKSNFFLK